ncbi:MAG: leucine--tRNA ligase, partial [Candidatus Atribacteria bacterium]
KFLNDKGLLDFDEPFANLFTQGMITRHGAKMSKSAGNTVDPKPLIDKYGADTVRLYTLFIGPPEKDAEWNDRSVEGAYRFINRVWRLFNRYQDCFASKSAISSEPEGLTVYELDVYRKTQQTIARVKHDILDGNFHFNTAISALMELTNTLYLFVENTEDFISGKESSRELLRYSLENIIILLAPMAPHMCEELWEKMGNSETIFKERLPEADKRYLKSDTYTLVLQINGKIRSKIEVEKDIEKEILEQIALEDEKIKPMLSGKEIRKIIIVPGKLVNIVAV